MNKVMPPPRSAFQRERDRFPGGVAFLALAAFSIAIWAVLIAFVF